MPWIHSLSAQLAAISRPIKPNLQTARQRLKHQDSHPLYLLAASMLGLAFLQNILFAAGGHHIGFMSLNPWLNSLLPDFVWAWITRFGDERVLLALCLLFARRRPEIIWALLIASLIALIYIKGLKHLLDIPRPPGVLNLQDIKLVGPALTAHSYPSGHTATIFVFCGVLFAFARHTRERAALLLLASLVGLSRIAIGVHWPQDVLAGAFGGLGSAALGVIWARHWLAGLNLTTHLTVIGLICFGMLSLLFVDGGNPATPILIYPLVFAMFWRLVLDYYPWRGMDRLDNKPS